MRCGGAAAAEAVQVVLVGLLVLVLVEPGLGIQCYSCINHACDVATNPPCNIASLPVCNRDGNKGKLSTCNGVATCKEMTFSSVPGVYRSCGDDDPIGCDGQGKCTCDTDGCNVHLTTTTATMTASALWWWLMAVPAVAAVLLTVAAVLRVRQRRWTAEKQNSTVGRRDENPLL